MKAMMMMPMVVMMDPLTNCLLLRRTIRHPLAEALLPIGHPLTEAVMPIGHPLAEALLPVGHPLAEALLLPRPVGHPVTDNLRYHLDSHLHLLLRRTIRHSIPKAH